MISNTDITLSFASCNQNNTENYMLRNATVHARSVTQLCPMLCNSMDCSLPGSEVMQLCILDLCLSSFLEIIFVKSVPYMSKCAIFSINTEVQLLNHCLLNTIFSLLSGLCAFVSSCIFNHWCGHISKISWNRGNGFRLVSSFNKQLFISGIEQKYIQLLGI